MVAVGFGLDDKGQHERLDHDGQPHPPGGPYPLTIPADTRAGKVAVSDASGNVSWGTASGGGGAVDWINLAQAPYNADPTRYRRLNHGHSRRNQFPVPGRRDRLPPPRHV